MDKIRTFSLGGLDENGKNLTVIEINDDIYVIDAGLSYPQRDLLGVEILIPDMRYLIENKRRIKAVFITHGHNDVLGALPYLIKEVNVPVYTTAFTAKLIERSFKEHNIRNAKVFKVNRNGAFKVDSRRIISFGLTHSIPDTFGIAIESDLGYLVYTSEFMIDFDVSRNCFTTDIASISDIGKRGVFLLMCESFYAKREGFTSPNHRIRNRLEKIYDDASERIFVTLYNQNVFRFIEVVDMAKRFNRKIYMYGDEQRQILAILEELDYYHVPKNILMSDEEFNNDYNNVVIIVSDTGSSVFSKMTRIAMGEDPRIQFREKDQVVIASPQVPGTEKIGNAMIDELFKDGVSVTNLSYKDLLSMHASEEDLKMMLSLMKPKYYLPMKGEYQDLVAGANVANKIGISPANIVILDNGQVAEFIDGRLKSTSEIIELETVMIDGKDHLDTSGLVLRDRQTLATDGTVVVGIVLDNRTKEVVGGPDIQSRGVIYLKDSENIMKEVGAILERIIQKNVAANDYDNIQTRNEAREMIVKYLFKETGKRPIVLPVIIEITV